jgi:CubicO group peptidase (beta-lactamase class C family)
LVLPAYIKSAEALTIHYRLFQNSHCLNLDAPDQTTAMVHKTLEFEKLVQEKMEEWKVPGLSIAIVQGDEIFTKVIGICLSKMTRNSFS